MSYIIYVIYVYIGHIAEHRARWELPAQNPPIRKQDPGVWTFGTYISASDYPTTTVIDKAVDSRGLDLIISIVTMRNIT